MSLHLDYNGDGRVSPAEDHLTYNRMRAEDDGAGGNARRSGRSIGCWGAVLVAVFVIAFLIGIFLFG